MTKRMLLVLGALALCLAPLAARAEDAPLIQWTEGGYALTADHIRPYYDFMCYHSSNYSLQEFSELLAKNSYGRVEYILDEDPEDITTPVELRYADAGMIFIAGGSGERYTRCPPLVFSYCRANTQLWHVLFDCPGDTAVEAHYAGPIYMGRCWTIRAACAIHAWNSEVTWDGEYDPNAQGHYDGVCTDCFVRLEHGSTCTAAGYIPRLGEDAKVSRLYHASVFNDNTVKRDE